MEIPKTIFQLTNISKLDFGGNNLQDIPQELASLTELSRLTLSENKIEKIPEGVLEPMHVLEEIDLSSNKIAEIPNVLSELVERFDIFKCFSYNQGIVK